MPLTNTQSSFGFVVALTILVACGGAAESNYGPQGATSGGALAVGGAMGQGGGIHTDDVCCNSRPFCRDGDQELGSGASCPADSDCYKVDAICCSPAIYCAHSRGASNTGGTASGGSTSGGNTNGGARPSVGGAASGGNASGGNTNGGARPSVGGAASGGNGTGGLAAGGSGATGNQSLGGWSWGIIDPAMAAVGGACSAPACASGYVPLSSSSCVLSGPTSCYTMTSCGGTFGCQKSGTTCDRAAEYARKYQYADTSVCQVTNIGCPVNTTVFKDACGCGCEQPSNCPQWIDCMPGLSTPSVLCSDATICPFTLRAL